MTTPDARRLSLEIPEDLIEAIETEAAARTLGRNALIEHLLRFGLARLRPVQDLFEDQ